jgi:hypothetical protein
VLVRVFTAFIVLHNVHVARGDNLDLSHLCSTVSSRLPILTQRWAMFVHLQSPLAVCSSLELLTHSMQQSPSWEANRLSASQELPTFYGTRRFITAFTSARHLSLSCRSYQSISPGPRQVFMLHNYASFYGEDLSAPRPNPKVENHPLSAVRDCLVDIFAATLHIGGRSSIRNLRTRHAVVTVTH